MGTEYNYTDNNGNSVYDPENGTTPADTDTRGSVVNIVIIEGQDPNVSFVKEFFNLSGMLQVVLAKN